MQQQTQLTGWRLNVRNWLKTVIDQQYRYLNADFARAATELKRSFPKNILVMLVAQLVRPLALWFVKSALKDAAADLGVNLDDATLAFLSDLAVDAMLAG